MFCKMGFAEQGISWLMLCISTFEYYVLFNGTVVASVVPKRGVTPLPSFNQGGARGRRETVLDWDSLPAFSDIGVPKSYN